MTYPTGHQDATAIPVDDQTEQKTGLPRIAVYAIHVPVAAAVSALTAFDAQGHLVMACNSRNCTRP